jgi:acetylornithine/succinyldiaminopimelate/putrescine aminotransferase
MNALRQAECSHGNTVEKHKTACTKSLNVLSKIFRALTFQWVRLWRKYLLSRTLIAYESGLDLADVRGAGLACGSPPFLLQP